METLTEKQIERLQYLLSKTDVKDSALPGLSDDEAAEVRMLAYGLDEVTAREIAAIERGQSRGDLIEIAE